MPAPRSSPPEKPTRKVAVRKKVQKTRAEHQVSPPPVNVEREPGRITKHDLVVTLLSRRDGATIPDLMEATGWQQHSIRGFLAATVKKKLGLTLASTQEDGKPRRYRIIDSKGR